MKVQDVYTRDCRRFLEPNGLQSSILTVDDFLRHFAGTIEDFLERTGILKMIATQAIDFSVGVYEVPDQMSHVENVFVSGRMITRESMETLSAGVYQWRKAIGMPRSFHEDGLPAKRIELYPRPNYQGAAMPLTGPNTFQSPETNNYFLAGDFYPTMRGLTIVGPQVPLNPDWTVKTTWALVDDLPDGMPDSVMPYLAWGVLADMFMDDSEAKDMQRGQFCEGRYEEGVALFSAIEDEKCLDDPENAL